MAPDTIAGQGSAITLGGVIPSFAACGAGHPPPARLRPLFP
jgi:hypothetical protein